MWELIQQNRRKSLTLFVVMGFCLLFLGYLIGAAYLPPDGGMIGITLALIIWLILSMISFFAGDSIVLSISGAREVTPDVHPQLFNVVEEMKIAASLPKMPKVYIIDEAAPNAFATGRKPENCAIAVTTGLLSKLNRDELQGVVAHETSHIVNRDVLFMTFAGIMLGSIVLISQVFLRGLWFSGGSSRRYRSSSSDRGGGQGQIVIMIVAIVFAILAPILAQLLYFAISRRREYLADASAVRLTRYPEGLASALERISTSTEPMPRVNKVTAPMYIVNPLRKEGMKMSDLTSTHPPISERVKILRGIASGAGLNNYQEAYSRVTGQKSQLIPDSGLKETAVIPIRTGAAKTEPEVTAKSEKRGMGDLVRAINGFLFLTCTCGLKIKIPPDFAKPSVACPRCNRELTVPTAELTAITAALAATQQSTGQVAASAAAGASYKRQGTGWESFTCACGKTLQLSPAFEGTQIACSQCGTITRIES
jgi:heat shock protein HtpX